MKKVIDNNKTKSANSKRKNTNNKTKIDTKTKTIKTNNANNKQNKIEKNKKLLDTKKTNKKVRSANKTKSGKSIKSNDNLKNLAEQNKILIPPKKKTRKVFLSLLSVLIILVSAFITYVYFACASFLIVKTNSENCYVYVASRKLDFQRLEIPKTESDTYSYEFDIEILIKDTPDTMYLVTFTLDCNKYDFLATSGFEKDNGVYSKVVSAGERITLISQIGFASNSKVERFKVYLNIDIQKL